METTQQRIPVFFLAQSELYPQKQGEEESLFRVQLRQQRQQVKECTSTEVQSPQTAGLYR